MNETAGVGLFRSEASSGAGARLHGDVSLAMPVSWHLMGLALLSAVILGLTFVALAPYSKTTTVGGSIVLDKGVVPIMPSRAGIALSVDASEGMQVEVGAPLATIRSDEFLGSGGTVATRLAAAIAEQDRRVVDQSTFALRAGRAESARLVAQIRGLKDELASLDVQIHGQGRLVVVARREFARAAEVADQGFVSRRDLDARESALISREQQVAQLEQARSAKMSEIAQAREAVARSEASARADTETGRTTRAQLSQQAASVEATGGYVLTAPVSGTVTALVSHPGDPAVPGQPMMVILPRGGRPRAELRIPTSAAGFVEVGQRVRLAIDAYPFERFGVVEARIASVAKAAIPRAESRGDAVPVYVVTADIPRPWIDSFGIRHRLLPGMTLSARIVTRRQTVLAWLLEPLNTVHGR